MYLWRTACAIFLLATSGYAAPTTNPADRYKALFKELDAEGRSSEVELGEVETALMDARTATFLAKHQASIRALIQARRLPEVGWPATG